jgi:hypothetical protein
MARFTNPWDLARHEEATFEEIKRRARSIHTGGVVKIAKDAAGQLLSGDISTKEFRAAGHPMARNTLSRRGFRRTRDPFRKGRGQMSEKVRGRHAGAAVGFPKLPINEQTGALKRSMRVVGEIDTGRLIQEYGSGQPASQMLRIGFVQAYAAYVLRKGGTRLMVDRGYQAAFARIEKKRNTEMERDIRLMVLTVAARRSA